MTQTEVQLGLPTEPSSVRLVATLGVAGLFSGLTIVGAHVTTLPIIEANNARALERAVFTVLPGSERMQGLVVADGVIRVADPEDQADLFAGYDYDGTFVGYAIPGEGPGFQDTIRLIYGFDPESRRIVGMEVLESRETPGLGDKIYKDEDFVTSFSALSVDPRVMCVKPGEGTSAHEVDAITGATISSKAVVSIINGSNERWLDLLPGPESAPALESPSPEPEESGGAGGVRGATMAQIESDPRYEEFVKGIWRENPVFVQVLGMCPMLAVTNSAMNGVAMGGATTFVLVGSSLLVSLFRNHIPKQVRISTYIIIIATFVTVADLALKAMAPAQHKELGAFISLIVVNCLILGRQEAFSSKNTVSMALADAIGMALGFSLALVMLGGAREILGSGSFFGVSLFGPNFEPWVIMILPPGGFLMLGVMLLIFSVVREQRERLGERLSQAQSEEPSDG